MILVSFISGGSIKLEAPSNIPIPRDRVAAVGGTEAEGPFSFMVVGDIRRGTRWFQVLMEKAARRNPAFIILIGDFVNMPKLGEYRFFFKTVKEINMKIPLVMAPGNHDVASHGRLNKEIYKRFFGDLYYYFSYADSLFVVLDGATINIDDEQFRWLEKVLDEVAPGFKHVFLLSHVPPIPLEYRGCKCMAEGSRKRLEQILAGHHVDMFLSGHLHNYYRTDRNGTTYIVTGGGGSPLYKFMGGEGFHHMVEVKVTPEGLQDNIISAGGVSSWTETLDYFLVARLHPLMSRHAYLFIAQLAAGIFFTLMQVRAIMRRRTS